jgi:ComF family protein
MNAASPVIRSAHALLDFLLPRACVSCDRQLGAGESGIACALCWSRLAVLASPRCDRCGHPTQGRECRFCASLPPFVRAARSACWVPQPVASAIVRALKYHGWESAAQAMAERMARLAWPSDVVDERAALVPVPLAPVRQRERGFNQATLIANALGACWRVPVWDDVLVRARATSTQTRLTPGERSANVRDAFAMSSAGGVRERVRGLHIVLLDDVLTTGATLNACAATLFDAGARTVSYVTFGRAHAAGDR